MLLAKDFEDFIRLLNKYQVKYMIVGGYALAFHGKPRHTGDLDIWINISEKNANLLLKVIKDFGMGSLGLVKDDFMKPGYLTQIGQPPLRIDILNSIDGIEFDEAWENKQLLETEDLSINFISAQDFIQNKLSSRRKQDLVDVKEILKKTKK